MMARPTNKQASKQARTHLVVDDLTEPLTIPVEHKSINANLLVVSHTALLDQARLVTNGAQRSHKPAVTVPTLTDVVGRGPVDEKLGLVKYVHDPLDRKRAELRLAVPIRAGGSGGLPLDAVQHAQSAGCGHGRRRLQHVEAVLGRRVPAVVVAAVVVLDVVQRVQAVPAVEFEVDLQVEVRVPVLLVDPAALPDDLGDLVPALCRRVLVGLLGCLGRAEALGRGTLGRPV